MKERTRHVITVVAVLATLAVGIGVFVYSGVYNIGADDPHTRPVFAMMQMLRDRSIHLRSKDIQVPNLDDPQLILKGAGQYAAMCTGCHLAPGMKDSEIRPGLYPRPPNLSQARVDPQDAFWVIKHGIKMSAMPAWGFSHDDPTIWSMVAFLRKLPDLTPAQYEDMVAKAPPDEDMDMGEGGHGHHHGDAAEDGEQSHEHAGGNAGVRDEGQAPAGDSGDHGHADAAVEAPLSLQGLTPGAVPGAETAARAFGAALQRGDRDAVLAMLAPEVQISEGGRTQTRDEYAGSHLGEDIAFLENAKVVPISMGSMPMGATAMVGSETLITTARDGKPTTLRSREMLTLRKEGSAWKIVAIRWQSSPAGEK